ncbi:Dam family site-specific DNA-(adenine-N6)-methyltransferase [Salmonella enterica]|uniref:site-specific DNA-methyltransferase (adenine-specific) n=2 Tax=Salmonella enterica I TaxID=59201 RepID=A0A5X8YPK3_SALET|nr:Dam family site-specific DNA-(adenine-N6)-methyltransferase [Salmonella enterica]EBY9400581.1 Dam family site-specific DNA-(adenine-N6)-methyltransferase [Salmonella enterica subsp. enterica serovar Kisarawe]ECB4059564.1 Dam family site-specific DNA-(adenine-N6)-methyltransferase [Salmonella enterica subsp. enterica serovar Minnesota]ECJ2878620.1 Dam family site-specific DNA-(adenine-N6)-methyltransferase [Salmonella enterica subsp. enterica serovar Pomona]EDR3036676.1 Dam family site-specif
MSGLSYGSVCSGIEAASIAWEPLGMRPAWFSEIEPFPCAVLAERWPEVPNLGDMTKIAASIAANEVAAPDLLVGGTPCQAFSIAGLRNGLADKRGQLTLSYVELANAIDDKRRERGEEETIIVWENVPGVLSSKDNAFGCFLAGLAGESSELQPSGGKWTHAGCVSGPERVIAWRVLDAQFFGVAQRRRRVFVVASARKGFDPAEVLFEFDGVRRDTPPRREPQTAVTADAGNGAEGGSHWDNPANPHPTLNQSSNTGGIGASNQEIFSQRGAGIVGAYRMTAFGEYSDDGTASTVKARDYKDATDLAVTYSDISRTLLSKSNDSTAEDLETYAIHGTQDPDTNHELAHTLGRNHGQENAIITEPYTIAIRGREEGSTVEVRNDGTANALLTPDGGRAGMGVGAVGWGMQVRRLTPVECERLQGFPDNHTLIPWRGKDAADCPDGPRYKAIGNSMAVPVMRWIGKRIIERLSKTTTPSGRIKPFLKWAGGKFGVIDDLLAHMPQGRRLIEPFAGGGSIFLNAGFDEAIVSDACQDLILTYQVMQREPLALIDKANVMFREGNNPEYFDDIKVRFNRRDMTQMERAAAFIYLNRHCYNGLMRYNRQGEFNVGFGKYRQPYFPLAELEAFSAVASRCTFAVADCNDTVALAGEGDVVFCDPPYEPMPGKSGFTNYSGQSFRFDDQVRLAQSLKAAHQRGASVVITNSGAPAIRELYTSMGFDVRPLRARRSISCTGETRETVTDIIGVLA